MQGATGWRKFAYRWLIHRHYKRRLLVRWNLEGMIRRNFYRKLGYKLNLKNPQTFNEKIQWFKLFVRDPMVTRCADKYAVREYVKKKVGGAVLVPLLGVYNTVEEIELGELPHEFVFKPNHEAGRVIICHDKDKIDWKRQADVMKNWLRENYYYQTGEWQYKNISPKILCEKLLHGEIIDYKFFCFGGEPILVQIIGNRKDEHFDLGNYDLSFELIECRGDETYFSKMKKPPHWDKMIQIAEVLSSDFPFVRVDLYDLEGKVYFGELTFTPADGMGTYFSYKIDKRLGSLYDLAPFQEEFEKNGQVVYWCKRSI